MSKKFLNFGFCLPAGRQELDLTLEIRTLTLFIIIRVIRSIRNY